MTEFEWIKFDTAYPMLRFVADRMPERRMRLFGVSLFEHIIEDRENDPRVPVLKEAELAADEPIALPSDRELMQAYVAGGGRGCDYNEFVACVMIASDPKGRRKSTYGPEGTWLDWLREACSVLIERFGRTDAERFQRRAERQRQADLVREVVGNPFQSIEFDPYWRTSTVLEVGRTIYENKYFEQLPILADALVDAGCDATAVIEHLHSPGPHVKGCWALDLTLGKNWLA